MLQLRRMTDRITPNATTFRFASVSLRMYRRVVARLPGGAFSPQGEKRSGANR